MTDQLRSIFDRWQNLEAEKAATREGLKELFIEAKGNGYEPKALRLAFRKKVAADEPETDTDRALSALVDQYLAALEFDAGVRLVRARAPARVENIEEISPESGKAPRGLKLADADGKQSQPNTGGGHEVAGSNAQDVERGRLGREDKAVPADPVAARIYREPYPGDDDPLGPDMPVYLRRIA